MVERLQVQSRSPFEIHHILTGLEKTPETNVEAELFIPEGEGPFGCIIDFLVQPRRGERRRGSLSGPTLGHPIIKTMSMVGSMLGLRFVRSIHSPQGRLIPRLTINSQ